MLGIRASPTGSHILVLLRAAPSEIWGVSNNLFRILVTRSCHDADAGVRPRETPAGYLSSLYDSMEALSGRCRVRMSCESRSKTT